MFFRKPKCRLSFLIAILGCAFTSTISDPAWAGDYITSDYSLICSTYDGISQYWTLRNQGSPSDAELKAIHCFKARKGLIVRPLAGVRTTGGSGIYRAIISTEDGKLAEQLYIMGMDIIQRDGSKLTPSQWQEIPYSQY